MDLVKEFKKVLEDYEHQKLTIIEYQKLLITEVIYF